MSDPVADLKRALLAAADRLQAQSSAPVAGQRFRGDPRRHRLVLIAGVVSIAAAVALLVTTPWNDSPGFLDRAHAALTPPSGAILHQKWEVTSTSTDPSCTVTRGPNEIWIDQAPPYRYRALLNNVPADPATADVRALACSSGTASELGSVLDSGETLVFVPPNTLRYAPVRFMFPTDPVGDLREAISTGRAHDEGKTELDGRTVARVRIDPPLGCPVPDCSSDPSYAYVDPETFYPVQLTSPHGYIVPPGGPVVRLHLVMRTLAFEYLPRTPANVELTDIRAQHPSAAGPKPLVAKADVLPF